jgi:hypothetical protein
LQFTAALDPPGETRRQVVTLVVWLLFLGAAVMIAAMVGTHMPSSIDPLSVDPAAHDVQDEIQRSRGARFRVALLVGVLAPALCTLLLWRRHRRNGPHARGIAVELTKTELRIWGRGYGSRVTIAGAEAAERLVDVYAGRLGAWRQIRLRLRTKHQTLEVAAPAVAEDERQLRVEGGEADCIELERKDYDALKAEIFRRREVVTGAIS